MSNRSGYNKQVRNKSFVRTEKKFIPKAGNSQIRESITNPSLANSLRQCVSTQSSDAATSSGGTNSTETSTARVRLGENGNWVSSRIHGSNFVNYLPQDEAVAAGLGVEDGGLDPVESQRVVDLLNRESSRLLKLSPRDFWREVASDISLHDFLDSFLKFRNRWYDFPHHGAKGIVAGVIIGESNLSRRVFMVLYRISSNRDPGAHASDCLSLKEHGALLQENRLLDLPKLLDICAIYGHENEQLTRLLVAYAMKAQPTIHENLTEVVSHFLSIVNTMDQRCSSSLQALFSSGNQEVQAFNRLCADFLEVMDFINDAIVSIDAFVNAYNPAAVYFSCPVNTSFGNGELLNTLARLHDSLLPSLLGGFRHVFRAGSDGLHNSIGCSLSNIIMGFKTLSSRIANFGWKLLDLCYLSKEVFEGSLPVLTATKIFPAKVEDPVIRGDILVQTFREINGISTHLQENYDNETFLQNVEKNYKLLSRLNHLRDGGWIFMDEEQFTFLSHILMPASKFLTKQSTMATPRETNLQMDEDAAITESKISQVKDLFPEYGKGFLAACLDVYNQNPEEVIQRILEGNLHEDLQSLDISLEMMPPSKSASSMSRNDKGKGALLESKELPSHNIKAATEERHREGPSSSSSSGGRYTRKSKNDLSESAILDSRDHKDSTKTAALASQFEYEDEYDDSFDELGLSLVESGFEEAEMMGDRIKSTPGKSWGAEHENSASSSSGSKWGSRKKPQFFVKDGKNYSYKVAGSVAVADGHQAALVNQAQKELIHGLGRGGNRPLGAVKMLTESDEQQENQVPDVSEMQGRGNSRGRGRRGGANGNYRKDRAMKKHFAGLGGY